VPLVSRIIANKQEHLLEAYRLLPNADDKKRFIKSVEYVDIELVDSVVAWLRQLFHNLVKNPTTSKSTLMNIKACNYLDADILRAERKQELFNRGLQTLSQGKVGLLLLCGGKNKRFGGTTKFLKPLNIPSKKSTMDLMFDRLKALFPLAKCEWSLRVFMVCSQ
jgi:UDP-N-acetylglucosamine pyrophosphorylase